jgi:succinate dehydrogenase / fumarate reductase iron-sulfur subunit
MLINGKPTLACNTQILDLTQTSLTVAPLPNFNVIRDLVPDLVPMFAVHAGVLPYIRRSDTQEMENPTNEYFQTPNQLEEFLQFTYCIKCGACMAACPTMATDRKYPGPMPLTQAYRYNVDSRDDGGKERKDIIAGTHGAFSCHYAGECSNVCPKGVDPARAIQLMKKDLVRDYLNLNRKKVCAPVNHPTLESKPKVAVPPFTVVK